ncbi:MAG: hypothetical protein H6858_07990 [Rhodospirillales bacterium]|nr:hypothetical protein [Alphaproteobacteria bacterium]MCB1839484.1 hypothetical protein [Alphaproteobacteria bacterium]MCB9977520.1 hypothetical protein [Rhodospirillales bacterium]
MAAENEFLKLWDVSGGFISQEDSEIVGGLGLDAEGKLHVVASETEVADRTLEEVCERVNRMNTFHVRKVANTAYVYGRKDEGFIEALEYYLVNQEFLTLSPFEGEL